MPAIRGPAKDVLVISLYPPPILIPRILLPSALTVGLILRSQLGLNVKDWATGASVTWPSMAPGARANALTDVTPWPLEGFRVLKRPEFFLLLRPIIHGTPLSIMRETTAAAGRVAQAAPSQLVNNTIIYALS